MIIMFDVNRVFGIELVMVLLVGGCEADAEPASPSKSDAGQLEATGSADTVTWRAIGAVEETDVRVAVLLGRHKARLYFCGDAESSAKTARWFMVEYDGGEHLEFEEDTWRVHAHLLGSSVVGEVELGDGITRSLQAEMVEPKTLAGLYEGTAGCGRLGLIVTQTRNDTLPTAEGACISASGGSPQQVNPIAPITAEAGKIRARTSGGGDSIVLLQAATLDPL